ncbi:MAG: hypothetical protein AAFY88_25295, partial [Acidobacteriota bacterium]
IRTTWVSASVSDSFAADEDGLGVGRLAAEFGDDGEGVEYFRRHIGSVGCQENDAEDIIERMVVLALIEPMCCPGGRATHGGEGLPRATHEDWCVGGKDVPADGFEY